MAILALALVVLMLSSLPAMANDFPLSSGDSVLVDALDYPCDAQEADVSIGSFAVSAWVVMAVADTSEDYQ